MAQTLPPRGVIKLLPRLHAESFARPDEVRTLPNFRVETVALDNDAHVVQPQNRHIPEYGVLAEGRYCRHNEWLSRAENEVRRAFSAGYEAVAELDPDLLYAWLAKVFYGVLFREALLPVDRASGEVCRYVPLPDELGRVMNSNPAQTCSAGSNGCLQPTQSFVEGAVALGVGYPSSRTRPSIVPASA